MIKVERINFFGRAEELVKGNPDVRFVVVSGELPVLTWLNLTYGHFEADHSTHSWNDIRDCVATWWEKE